ncbi:MAG: ABC transporter permease [Flavobacteriales bacterium]
MTNDKFSYRKYVWQQFKKNRPALFAFRFISVMAVIALLSSIIANDKPLYCEHKGSTYFPVFREYAVDLGIVQWPKDLLNIDWKAEKYESVIWAPIPYGSTEFDYNNDQYKSPTDEQNVASTRWHHWLGTDEQGRDVLSGVIHGTQTAFVVGIVSVSITLLIGIFLGAIAGYYGDHDLQISRVRFWSNFLFLPIAFFYGFQVRSYTISDAFGESAYSGFGQIFVSFIVFLAVMILLNLLLWPLKKIPFLGRKVSLPLDLIINRVIEVVVSIPGLILIMAVVAIIAKPSVFVVMILIGLMGWTGIARFVRAEMLRVKKMEFMEAAKAFGYSDFRTVVKHALPNCMTPVFIAAAFGVAGAILTESTLSFLGIGVAPEDVTWGSLLNAGRGNQHAYWLIMTPGIAIFIVVTFFNLIGEGLTDALDPRQKK